MRRSPTREFLNCFALSVISSDIALAKAETDDSLRLTDANAQCRQAAENEELGRTRPTDARIRQGVPASPCVPANPPSPRCFRLAASARPLRGSPGGRGKPRSARLRRIVTPKRSHAEAPKGRSPANAKADRIADSAVSRTSSQCRKLVRALALPAKVWPATCVAGGHGRTTQAHRLRSPQRLRPRPSLRRRDKQSRRKAHPAQHGRLRPHARTPPLVFDRID